MDHFYENTLVGLLCQEKRKMEKNISKLDTILLEEIKSLPSFKRYIEKHESNVAFLNDEDEMKVFKKLSF